MDKTIALLKAIADDSRLKILKLLLTHNYCVGALARRLNLTESAISQHLKVLREAGLLIGEKRGYFMHYDVDRKQFQILVTEFERLSKLEREVCRPEKENCSREKQEKCHVHNSEEKCSEEMLFTCYEIRTGEYRDGKNEV